MKFVEVREAYTVLSKPATRNHYDMMLESSAFGNDWGGTTRPYESLVLRF
jgi:DnaJ-class molecular chaperone